MVAIISALVAVLDTMLRGHHIIPCVIIEVPKASQRVDVSAKGISKLLCLALSVRHEGVELVELVSRDVLHHCMQPVLLSGVEVLVVEPEESVCHTGLQWPWSEPKLSFTKTSERSVYMFDSIERKTF